MLRTVQKFKFVNKAAMRVAVAPMSTSSKEITVELGDAFSVHSKYALQISPYIFQRGTYVDNQVFVFVFVRLSICTCFY